MDAIVAVQGSAGDCREAFRLSVISGVASSIVICMGRARRQEFFRNSRGRRQLPYCNYDRRVWSDQAVELFPVRPDLVGSDRLQNQKGANRDRPTDVGRSRSAFSGHTDEERGRVDG